MRSYEAARKLFSFLGFCAWCLIVVGILAAIGGIGAATQLAGNGFGRPDPGLAALIAAIPGAGIALAGILCLALVQMGRATVDTAELTQQMLKVARDQLEISSQGLRQGSSFANSFAAAPIAGTDTGNPGLAGTAVSPPSFTALGGDQPASAPKAGETIEYRGKNIRVVEGGYTFGGLVFATLEAAQARIDEDGAVLPPPASQTGVATNGKASAPTES